MRPANRGRGRFGNTNVADVARLDEARQRSIGFLNGRARIDARRLVEVDVIGPQAAQAVGEEIFYGFGAQIVAVERAVRPAHGAEFYGEEHILAPAFDGPADEHFVVAHAVEVAGIEHGDSRIERGVNRGDAFRFIRGAVHVGHGHAAQAELRNMRVHCVPSVLSSRLPNLLR